MMKTGGIEKIFSTFQNEKGEELESIAIKRDNRKNKDLIQINLLPEGFPRGYETQKAGDSLIGLGTIYTLKERGRSGSKVFDNFYRSLSHQRRERLRPKLEEVNSSGNPQKKEDILKKIVNDGTLYSELKSVKIDQSVGNTNISQITYDFGRAGQCVLTVKKNGNHNMQSIKEYGNQFPLHDALLPAVLAQKFEKDATTTSNTTGITRWVRRTDA
jgi:hypothetical protein